MKHLKTYESTDYSKFIGQTPVVINIDQVWIYKKIFYYKNKYGKNVGFYLCAFSDLAYDDSGTSSPEVDYIERDDEKIYYDIEMRNEFMEWLDYNIHLGKTKTEVENKIDKFFVAREAEKYNM